MTDPIADMLTRISDAIGAKHSRIEIPSSKLKVEIARLLKEEGYIRNFVLKGEESKRIIRIFLRYDEKGTTSINHLVRVSRPGALSRRRTMRKDNAPNLLYPTQASTLGREKIEAVVGMNLLKLKALQG